MHGSIDQKKKPIHHGPPYLALIDWSGDADRSSV